MFGFKKKRELRNGVIEKTTSYMMAVPRNIEIIKNPNEVIERLKNSSLFVVQNVEFRQNIEAIIEYEEEAYKVEIIPETYELGPMYTINHHLSEENYNIITQSDSGLTVAMTFGEDILKSYHLQLKILYTIVPNMAGVIDFCVERVLSSIWVKLELKHLSHHHQIIFILFKL